jgi:hypothetical protein
MFKKVMAVKRSLVPTAAGKGIPHCCDGICEQRNVELLKCHGKLSCGALILIRWLSFASVTEHSYISVRLGEPAGIEITRNIAFPAASSGLLYLPCWSIAMVGKLTGDCFIGLDLPAR